MHTIDIIETNKRLFVPEKLSECSPKQLASICNYIFLYQNGKLSYRDFQTHCLYALLNMKKSKKDLDPAKEELINANLSRIMPLLDSFFKVKNGKQSTIQDFKDNPVLYIPTPFHNFKGPKDIFYTTFGEYVEALDAFGAYQRIGNIDILYDLAAIFYRPHCMGYRSPKRPSKIKAYKRQLKKTYFGYIYAFYIYFSGFQDRLANQKILREGQEIDFSILFKSDKDAIPSKINGLGMKSQSYHLAESGVFGDLKKVNNTQTLEIILRMYDIKKRDIDHKAYMEAQQKKQSS